MDIARVRMSTLVNQLNDLLVDITENQLNSQIRRRNIRSAVTRLSQDRPKRNTVEFAGDGGMYYLLYGDIIGEDFTDRDAYLTLTDTDTRKAFQFTTTRELEIAQIGVLLSRVGATVDGIVKVKIYTDSSGPSIAILTSKELDIDEANSVPQGIYSEIYFALDEPYILPAGTYYTSIETEDYTYSSGTSELRIGVVQSGATNNAWTYTGSWAEESTASEGMFAVYCGLPGWSRGKGTVESVEYPAADISNDETPETLTHDDYSSLETTQGIYLYFTQYAPASTETIRIVYKIPYIWSEENDPSIDIPYDLQDAVCHLAAYFACLGLSTRYGQNVDSTFSADSIDRKSQSQDYRLLAKEYLATYKELSKVSTEGPGVAYADFDKSPVTGKNFIFHRRG